MGSAAAGSAAQQGLDAGQQLGEGEGLDQVVVAAGLEAAHAVVHGVARAQDEHGSPHAAAAQRLHECYAVQAREHDVHDRRVVGGVEGHLEPGPPLPGLVHGEPGLPQTLRHEGGDRLVVLDRSGRAWPHRKPGVCDGRPPAGYYFFPGPPNVKPTPTQVSMELWPPAKLAWLVRLKLKCRPR